MSAEINEQQEQHPNPHEEKARAAGWKPLAEFDGDPEKWIDAKEFVSRAPLYEKNHKLTRQVAELQKTMHDMKQHMSKVSQAAYDKAVRDLTAQRDEAIELGDKAQVKEIDKALKEAEAIKTPADDVHPAIKAWEADNATWFYADKEISNFGMAYAQNYLLQNPDDFDGAMTNMEKAIKKAFPEKFENQRRKDPPAVETGGKGEHKKTFGRSDLNDEQRKVMDRFVRNGVMTEADYIKDLVDSGVIGGKK